MSFRRIAFITVPVIGLALLGTITAGAAMRGRHGGFPFHPGGPGGPGDIEDHRAFAQERFEFALDRIGATEEQQAEIEGIIEPAVDQAMDAHADHEARHDEFRDLLLAETVDRDALEAMRAEAMDRFDEGSQLFVTVIADVAEVLTVEQREDLVELVQSHRMR
jgi:periplasmic protein CpxP/Spy